MSTQVQPLKETSAHSASPIGSTKLVARNVSPRGQTAAENGPVNLANNYNACPRGCLARLDAYDRACSKHPLLQGMLHNTGPKAAHKSTAACAQRFEMKQYYCKHAFASRPSTTWPKALFACCKTALSLPARASFKRSLNFDCAQN